MTRDEIRSAMLEVAQATLRWQGPLPSGELAEAFDSLQQLSLVVALEDRFRVRLDEEEHEIRTVEDLVRVLAAENPCLTAT